MLKNGSTVSYVAGHFSIGLQTVRDIKKNESSLDRYEIAYSGSSSLRKSLKMPTTDKVDEATYIWFKSQRASGVEINGMMIQLKTLTWPASTRNGIF